MSPVRALLRPLGTRYGAAAGLVVAIALIVGIGKIIGGGNLVAASAGTVANAPSAISSQEADDGVGAPPAPPTPSTSPGAADPQTVATDFTRAWLRHNGITADQWLAGLRPFATAALRSRLAGVDPRTVPASAIAGSAAATDRSESYVDMMIPLDAGALTLGLTASGGRWLVDSVDWRRP